MPRNCATGCFEQIMFSKTENNEKSLATAQQAFSNMYDNPLGNWDITQLRNKLFQTHYLKKIKKIKKAVWRNREKPCNCATSFLNYPSAFFVLDPGIHSMCFSRKFTLDLVQFSTRLTDHAYEFSTTWSCDLSQQNCPFSYSIG